MKCVGELELDDGWWGVEILVLYRGTTTISPLERRLLVAGQDCPENFSRNASEMWFSAYVEENG